MDSMARQTIQRRLIARVENLRPHGMGDGVFVRMALAADLDGIVDQQQRPLAPMGTVAQGATQILTMRDVAALQAGA